MYEEDKSPPPIITSSVVPIISVCPSTPILASFPSAPPYDPLNELPKVIGSREKYFGPNSGFEGSRISCDGSTGQFLSQSILQPPRIRHKRRRSSTTTTSLASRDNSPALSDSSTSGCSLYSSPNVWSSSSTSSLLSMSNNSSPASSQVVGTTLGCQGRSKSLIPPPLHIPSEISSFIAAGSESNLSVGNKIIRSRSADRAVQVDCTNEEPNDNERIFLLPRFHRSTTLSAFPMKRTTHSRIKHICSSREADDRAAVRFLGDVIQKHAAEQISSKLLECKQPFMLKVQKNLATNSPLAPDSTSINKDESTMSEIDFDGVTKAALAKAIASLM